MKLATGIVAFNDGKPFKRCLESLSQNENVPSEPAVAKVPNCGLKTIEFNEKYLIPLLLFY